MKKNWAIALAGFGKKEIKQKQKKSKKGLNITPEQLRTNAINAHMSGNITAAEKGYQSFIHSGINDPDVLSNYALICQESGRIDKALSLYETCTSLYPQHLFSNANLGYLYLSIGKLDKAEVATRKAIKLQPKLPNSYSTLGLILKAKGNLDEAELTTRKAIEIEPNFTDAFINLG